MSERHNLPANLADMSEITHPYPVGQFAGCAIQGIKQISQISTRRTLVTLIEFDIFQPTEVKLTEIFQGDSQFVIVAITEFARHAIKVTCQHTTLKDHTVRITVIEDQQINHWQPFRLP
jgi:hypothetical protein